MAEPGFTAGAFSVGSALYAGRELPCVLASDGDVIAAGCLPADAKLFAAAPDGYALAAAIVKLESSPLQSDYVPPAIQGMARALLAKVK